MQSRHDRLMNTQAQQDIVLARVKHQEALAEMDRCMVAMAGLVVYQPHTADANIARSVLAATLRYATRQALAVANVVGFINMQASEPECSLGHCCGGCDWYFTIRDDDFDKIIGFQCHRFMDKSKWPPVVLYNG